MGFHVRYNFPILPALLLWFLVDIMHYEKVGNGDLTKQEGINFSSSGSLSREERTKESREGCKGFTKHRYQERKFDSLFEVAGSRRK